MFLTRVLTLTSTFSSQHHKLKENVPNSNNHVEPCYGAEVIRKLGKDCSNTCWDERIAPVVFKYTATEWVHTRRNGLAYRHHVYIWIKPGPIRLPTFAETA